MSGYIGFQTLTLALERGYRVRAVVRKLPHIEDLKRSPIIAASLQQERLEIVLLPDFYTTDAFFKCLNGITVIIHLASPMALDVGRPSVPKDSPVGTNHMFP